MVLESIEERQRMDVPVFIDLVEYDAIGVS